MKQKMETSKKIALFAAICFAVVLLFCILAFGYESYIGTYSDPTLLVSLVTVSGAAFGTACAFYYNKSKAENLFKLKRSFLEDKYTMMKEMGALDKEYLVSEIEGEINEIETGFDAEEYTISQDINYTE